MSNILSLIRLGFLPPKFSEDDLEKTIYYKIWDSFRIYCYFADVKKITPLEINCKKLAANCEFGACPILKLSIEKYEKGVKRY